MTALVQEVELVRSIRHHCGCPYPAALDRDDVDWRIYCCPHYGWIIASEAQVYRLRFWRSMRTRLRDEEWSV